MNMSTGLKFLRPYLCKDINITKKSVYVRFYHNTKCMAGKAADATISTAEESRVTAGSPILPATILSDSKTVLRGEKQRISVNERIEALQHAKALSYPRIERDQDALTIKEFEQQYNSLEANNLLHNVSRTVRGRVHSVRVAGNALIFMDIIQDGHGVQVIFDRSYVGILEPVSKTEFKLFSRLIQRGDIISVTGCPSRSGRGQLSVRATDTPTIMSPTLAKLPTELEDRETRIRNRHVDLLVNRKVVDTLRARSHIIRYLRDFLLKDDFLEVQTPIIADKAGGAVAKPFTTIATEFSDKQLALRIAPEIWLKRMILGGMDRVFEIGPAFRNEGLDATHNPEFTTCEFYKSYANLEDLILMTEEFVSGLAEHISSLRQSTLIGLPEIDTAIFKAPFKRIEFIPAIEAALGESLPDLQAEDADAQILSLFEKHDLAPPASPTLPRLLDRLAAFYIEPHCNSPTFITHHPACMAPLSKSFLCEYPSSTQLVSARAELFIHHKEVANMYEEENSPFEQRRKFEDQIRWKDAENGAHVDESYLRAMEYALPPTGGWGCGIDRLCMLLSGATRISDVLSFGSLRNVVGLGREVERD